VEFGFIDICRLTSLTSTVFQHPGFVEFRSSINSEHIMEVFTGIFHLPGEGFIAELRNGANANLYDRQGLQYLILERKQAGGDSQAAEQALGRLNTLQDQTRFSAAVIRP
jgi:hypothetical protein|tara:strand:- start:1561 stop:1890 length:330 start_codon:yes stop_codon:yes gene_type:complete